MLIVGEKEAVMNKRSASVSSGMATKVFMAIGDFITYFKAEMDLTKHSLTFIFIELKITYNS